ncbi:gas vesicle protein [Actinoplanes sp. NPDC049548]|uniref:gas vesicle protein n=1 Tax=Actinoplanes sp. NPDC049548 TaxID=3155152 RepID=UPI00341AFFC2
MSAPPVPLVDILDRVLARGVVVEGDIVLSIADIDLVRISLRALVSSVHAQLSGMPEEERW